MSLTPVIIERIQGLGIPTKSFTDAAYHVRDNQTVKAAGIKSNFDKLIKGLTEIEVPTANVKEAELVFGYLVQESVRSFNMKQYMEIEDCIKLAQEKTAKFLFLNPWVNPVAIAEKHEAAVIAAVAAGVEVKKVRIPRASGMSKKDRCLSLYRDNKEAFGTDKHKMINLFMEELGLSKPGATTYEYNCRKEIWK
jgi:hypothetical protein